MVLGRRSLKINIISLKVLNFSIFIDVNGKKIRFDSWVSPFVLSSLGSFQKPDV